MSERPYSMNELRVLAALLRPGEHYALGLTRTAGVSVGSIYATLDRLEDRNLLTFGWEDIDPVQAGRPPRCYYALTPHGRAVAEAEIGRMQKALTLYRAPA